MDQPSPLPKNKYAITYVFSFLVRKEKHLLDQMKNFGWRDDKEPYSVDQRFRITRYFSSTASKLYLNDVRYFSLARFSGLCVADAPELSSRIEKCRVLIFPGSIGCSVGQLHLSIESEGLGEGADRLCDLHERLRAWSNSFSEGGEPKGASALHFRRSDGGSNEYFDPDDFDADLNVKVSALLTFLLGGTSASGSAFDKVVDPVCDRRSPALIFASTDKANVNSDEFLYRLIAGDGSGSPLPSSSYVRSFLANREASPYFGKGVSPTVASRSAIDGYGFVLIGGIENAFFNNVIYSSFQSIYSILFSLLWYQYAFLLNSLERLEQISENAGDPHSKDVEEVVKDIGRYLNPSLLSFGSREEQALLLLEIGQRTLGIDKLYEKLDRQAAYWHNYSVTVETRSTANAAVIIGLLSVLGLVVSVLFGVADLNGVGSADGSPLRNMVRALVGVSVAGFIGLFFLGFFSTRNPKGFLRSIAIFYLLPYVIFLGAFTVAVWLSFSS
ncbi:hypothetical protein ACTTAL_07105 [Rhodobacter capsulatus]|uniref:hypothetical protein n=1 Tax=Rhodobacter capsulatus TaxID=1061 RepID=UPI000403F566|nr:hypothetical protein [Rhodobacter capsulatus]